MNREILTQLERGGAEDEAAALITSWVTASSDLNALPDCPPWAALHRLVTGKPAADELRRGMFHFASCTRCRGVRRALLQHGEASKLARYSIEALRKAALSDGDRVSRLLTRVHNWLTETVTNSVPDVRANQTEMAVFEDSTGVCVGAGVLSIEKPLAIDRSGRLTIAVNGSAAMHKQSLVVAVQNAGVHLEIAAIGIKESRAEAYVDVSFLGSLTGVIPFDHVVLSVVPTAALEERDLRFIASRTDWLLNLHGNPLEIWDYSDDLYSVYGSGWGAHLSSAFPDAATRNKRLTLLTAALKLYADLWRAGGNGEPPNSTEILEAFSDADVLDISVVLDKTSISGMLSEGSRPDSRPASKKRPEH